MNLKDDVGNSINKFQNKTEDYLNKFKNKFDAKDIISILDSLNDLKVLVIGECILDEYVFCDVMERAKKEPILVFKHSYTELYAGGVLAIANHAANFADNVSLITSASKDEKTMNFLRGKLNSKILLNIFPDMHNTVLIKRRYVYSYKNTKVFEVYSHSNYEISNTTEKEIIAYLKDNMDHFDVVIVGDFGHGLITSGIRETILSKRKFLAINAQTNSGNLGYNYITKYKNFDYTTLTEEELRLPLQDSKSGVGDLAKTLAGLINCKKICTTLGTRGIIYYEDKIHESPVFSRYVVDTVGAGDAILAITAMLAYKKVDPEIIPFVGNCVGALAIRIMGNKEPINPIDLNRFITNLLK